MKKSKLLLSLYALILTTSLSCKKNVSQNASVYQCSPISEVYSNNEGTFIDLNHQWYIKKCDNGGGSVFLKIDAITNGDSVKITTFGDGKLYDQKIKLDSEKKIIEDIEISFTATSIPNNFFKENTTVYVFKNDNILKINIESCDLKY